MKLAVAENEVETGGTTQSGTFSIKSNAKAFRIVIDSLYSDKPLAILRELSTNAFDAHIEVGTPERAFEWTIPTMFEPSFKVRDYGPGLSNDDIFGLYTTVFASTKDQDNEQVGAFGLGSKTPFSYTDTFTVVSRHHGEKRTYSAYIGADGVPRIDAFGVEDCDEESGLEVSFPVKTKDVSDFVRAARSVANGFTVKPVVEGASFDMTPPVTILDGEGWALLAGEQPGAGWSHRNVSYARQGCVLYKIDPSAVPQLSRTQREILTSDFVIDFEIGELAVSASRESLSYDDATCENIEVRVARIEKEITEHYSKDLANATTPWEANVVARSVMANYQIPSVIRNTISNNMTWRGKGLPGTAGCNMYGKGMIEIAASYTSAYDVHRRKTMRWNPTTRLSFTISKFTRVLVQHVKHGEKRLNMPGPRIKHWHDPDNYECDVVWIKADVNSYAFKRLLVKLGRPPFIRVDTLERPETVRKTPGPRRAVSLRKLVNTTWRDTQHNPEDGGLYVPLMRGQPVGSDTHTVGQVLAKMKELGHVAENALLIGIPGTFRTLPQKHEGWVNLLDEAQKVIDENLDPETCAKAQKYAEQYEGQSATRYGSSHSEQTNVKALVRGIIEGDLKFDKCGPASWLYTKMMKAKDFADAAERATKYNEMANAIKLVELPEVTISCDTKLVEKVIATYPMLRWITDNYSGPSPDQVKDMVAYINQVDALA